MTEQEHIGHLVCKYSQSRDEDPILQDRKKYIPPDDREIGIFLSFEWPDHCMIFWQEQQIHEKMWLGALTFLDY